MTYIALTIVCESPGDQIIKLDNQLELKVNHAYVFDSVERGSLDLLASFAPRAGHGYVESSVVYRVPLADLAEVAAQDAKHGVSVWIKAEKIPNRCATFCDAKIRVNLIALSKLPTGENVETVEVEAESSLHSPFPSQSVVQVGLRAQFAHSQIPGSRSVSSKGDQSTKSTAMSINRDGLQESVSVNSKQERPNRAATPHKTAETKPPEVASISAMHQSLSNATASKDETALTHSQTAAASHSQSFRMLLQLQTKLKDRVELISSASGVRGRLVATPIISVLIRSLLYAGNVVRHSADDCGTNFPHACTRVVISAYRQLALGEAFAQWRHHIEILKLKKLTQLLETQYTQMAKAFSSLSDKQRSHGISEVRRPNSTLVGTNVMIFDSQSLAPFPDTIPLLDPNGMLDTSMPWNDSAQESNQRTKTAAHRYSEGHSASLLYYPEPTPENRYPSGNATSADFAPRPRRRTSRHVKDSRSQQMTGKKNSTLASSNVVNASRHGPSKTSIAGSTPTKRTYAAPVNSKASETAQGGQRHDISRRGIPGRVGLHSAGPFCGHDKKVCFDKR